MNWASPRAVLNEIGLFRAGLFRCSDVDGAFRVVEAGYRLVYEPSAVVHHRNRDTVLTLMWEGYRHGYYLVPVRAIHRRFVSAYPAADPRSPWWSGKPVGRRVLRWIRSIADMAGGDGHFPWAFLFRLAKSAGTVHGTAAALVRRRG
jgi:GT2 family glycosyltransferase